MGVPYNQIPLELDPVIAQGVQLGFMAVAGQLPAIGEYTRDKIIEIVIDNIRDLPGEFTGESIDLLLYNRIYEGLLQHHSRITPSEAITAAQSIRFRVGAALANDPTMQYLIESRARPSGGTTTQAGGSGGGTRKPIRPRGRPAGGTTTRPGGSPGPSAPKAPSPSPSFVPGITIVGTDPVPPPVPPPPPGDPGGGGGGGFVPPPPLPPDDPGYSPPQIQPTFPGEDGFEPPQFGDSPYKDLPPPPPPEPEPQPATTSRKKKSNTGLVIAGVAAVGLIALLAKK